MKSKKPALKMPLEEVTAILNLYKVKKDQERNKDDNATIIRLNNCWSVE